MPKRIIDERTREPVDYDSLEQEAEKLAETEGIGVPAACKKIAVQANSDRADSIERQLRNRRKASGAGSRGAGEYVPPPGFGVWVEYVNQYAKELDGEIRALLKAGRPDYETRERYTRKVRRFHQIVHSRLFDMHDLKTEFGRHPLAAFHVPGMASIHVLVDDEIARLSRAKKSLVHLLDLLDKAYRS